jgi:hypothetical protein
MWTRSLLISKLKGMGIHFLISAVIFVPIFYLLWVYWFPPPLFFTDGGRQGLQIMIPVDLVIGPLLTFIVFNPAKPRRELIGDLSVIALVQVVALVFGYVSVDKRSIRAVVWSGGAFNAVQRQVFRTQKLPENAWDQFGDGPVYWAYQREPVGSETKDVLALLSNAHLRLAETYSLLTPLGEHWDEVRKAALDMDAIGKENPALAEEYRQAQAKHPGVKLLAFRHTGQDANAILLLDESGKLVDALYKEHWLVQIFQRQAR